MTNFRTIVDIPKSNIELSYQHPSILIGSCFTENVGQKLIQDKFPTLLNPFGILYNPASIKRCFQILTEGQYCSEDDLHQRDGLWFSYDHHGSFSRADKAACLSGINNELESSRQMLQNARIAFITLGTSWVYRLKSNEQIVANCHKVPAREFDRVQLSVEQIVDELTQIIISGHSINPELKFVFTLSPVRHWKEGAHGNQLSKSRLVLAIDEAITNNEKAEYFPSYEIIMDELRDYRFYAGDMLHINETGTNYIYDRFQDTFFSEETIALKEKIRKITLARQHKPFNPNTEQHGQFVKKQLDEIQSLKKMFPSINFYEEQSYFESILNS
jgi:hypothetical protein